MISKLGRRSEWIPITLAITALLVSSVILSSKKYYWNDEIFSWFFLADPSFSDMWSAFNDKINNTPALYFILGWVWEKAFGDAEVSFLHHGVRRQ